MHLSRLRIGEHYKFHYDFSQLVTRFKPEVLGITLQYAAFGPLLTREYAVYEVIRKSDITDLLVDADILRDTTFSGLAGTIRSATCCGMRAMPTVRRCAMRCHRSRRSRGRPADTRCAAGTTAGNRRD